MSGFFFSDLGQALAGAALVSLSLSLRVWHRHRGARRKYEQDEPRPAVPGTGRNRALGTDPDIEEESRG